MPIWICSDEKLYKILARGSTFIEISSFWEEAGGKKNAHIRAHAKIAIDEIRSHYVSEGTNCSLVSISPCFTTHCIIYIEVQSYFIWCWQLFLELWVKCRHERVSRSRVRFCTCVCECVLFFCQYTHMHPHRATTTTTWTLQVCRCIFFFKWWNMTNQKKKMFSQILHEMIDGRNRKWNNLIEGLTECLLLNKSRTFFIFIFDAKSRNQNRRKIDRLHPSY